MGMGMGNGHAGVCSLVCGRDDIVMGWMHSWSMRTLSYKRRALM